MLDNNSSFEQTGHSKDMGQTKVSVKKFKDGKQVTSQVKNLKGDLGPICNYCAGLGFTNSLGGSALGCTKCNQTGVEPIDSHVLQNQINDLNGSMIEIKSLLKKVLKGVNK